MFSRFIDSRLFLRTILIGVLKRLMKSDVEAKQTNDVLLSWTFFIPTIGSRS